MRFHVAPAGLDAGVPEIVPLERLGDRGGERGGISWGDEGAAAPAGEGLATAGEVGGDDRDAGGHRFEQDQGEPLARRGEEADIQEREGLGGQLQASLAFGGG